MRLPLAAVSWGAVLAGAFVAAALSLILLILGTGLGLTAVSPWSDEGASAKTLGVAAIAWMMFVHLSSSALGGYIAGRLRTRWADVQSDEVYFRDTAHGLVAWAVGIVLGAALLSSAATAVVGGAAKAGAAVAGTAAAGAAAGAPSADGTEIDVTSYVVDGLFRSDRPREADDASVRQEAGRIIANGLHQDLTPSDRSYLTGLISVRTGLPQPEAEKRLTEAMTQARAAEAKAREAADAARKALIHLSIWTFLALLIGAFAASYAATIGGRQRDNANLRSAV
ncbi:MAG: hypothetical protein GEV05_29630 [Betaproteobacteria bacterium]|nr:hypothetical protein [Betaproteobacteria bacterium]